MKTFSQFIRESYGKFIPIDASKQSPTAIANILAARKKAEDEARQNTNATAGRSFHTAWSKEQKIKAIMAGSPGMSREEAAKKASLRIGKQKRVNESHNIETLKGIPTPRLRKLHAKYKAKGTKEASREASVIKRVLASRMNEAVSTNDPNRGKPGRKKPLVPQGMMPDDTVHPFTGKRVKSSGKVQKRLSTLSDAGRNEYYKKVGIRSRAASRGGRTQRLYWGLHEEEKKENKDRYEGEESTSSMIARLVARRHRKLGMKVPADVERDIDPKYKTKED